MRCQALFIHFGAVVLAGQLRYGPKQRYCVAIDKPEESISSASLGLCDGSASQQWVDSTSETLQIVSALIPNKCLEIGPNASNGIVGRVIQVSSCKKKLASGDVTVTAVPEQQFNFSGEGTLRWRGQSKYPLANSTWHCVEPQKGVVGSGTTLWLQLCSPGRATQQWLLKWGTAE